jgi:lipoprotein NlpD
MNKYNKIFIKLTILSLLFIVFGCSSNYKLAKIEDITSSNRVTKGIHIVDRGESLYSIAFRYGRDFRNLAAVNSIEYPYKILPGQKIYLNKTSYKRPLKSKNMIKNRKTVHKSKEKNNNLNEIYQENQLVMTGAWDWPVRGNVVTKYNTSPSFNKGIDIAVNTTTDVKSAANGMVVYRGAGLKGYGKLIIIKHSEKFLSAYAHNDSLLVNEGQLVKKGQKIAVIGEKTKILYFEIREDGKPIDPIAHLP